MNQTAKGKFYVWHSWRPEEKENPIVQDFIKFMSQIEGLDSIHTFGGIVFWDDKYTDETAIKRMKESLRLSLPDLKNHVGDIPYVLFTIQPSDDCYIDTAVEDIQKKAGELINQGVEKAAIGYKKGYIMNYATKEIAEYLDKGWQVDEISAFTTDTIPPFYTILFPSEVFLDPEKHFNHAAHKSHELIAEIMSYYDLDERGFCVGTHNNNISTTFNHRYKGRILTDGERTMVLLKLGIYYSEPIILKRPVRIWMRYFLNRLPTKLRHQLLTFYYHKIYDEFFKS